MSCVQALEYRYGEASLNRSFALSVKSWTGLDSAHVLTYTAGSSASFLRSTMYMLHCRNVGAVCLWCQGHGRKVSQTLTHLQAIITLALPLLIIFLCQHLQDGLLLALGQCLGLEPISVHLQDQSAAQGETDPAQCADLQCK
jgi:hypothetical protein